jgi:hypothetical protein
MLPTASAAFCHGRAGKARTATRRQRNRIPAEGWVAVANCSAEPQAYTENVRRHAGVQRYLCRLGALGLMLVLVGTLLSAGSRYFYCFSAARVHKAACCGKARLTEKRDVAPTRAALAAARGCCEERIVPGSPSAGVERAPLHPALAAPATVHLAWASPWQKSAAPEQQKPSFPIRAGPQAAAQRCVLLQVFLS